MSVRIDFSDTAIEQFFRFPISLHSPLDERLERLAESEAIRALDLPPGAALRVRTQYLSLDFG